MKGNSRSKFGGHGSLRVCIVWCITLFAVTALHGQPLPDLVIGEHTVDSLPPGSYSYDTIWIKTNGTLLIQKGSASWAVLHANTFLLDGEIIYRGLKSGAGSIQTTLSNGEAIKHAFQESARGGIGGDGGGNSFTTGGKGSMPDGPTGGGGGSGAQGSAGDAHIGQNGLGHVGASGPLHTTIGQGGNGGKTLFAHGGLLAINIKVFKSGPKARIDISGRDGAPGHDGEEGGCDRYDNNAGGGGGGGAAGGDGGVLIVRSKQMDQAQYPEVNVTGGKGGKGGLGGKPLSCNYAGRDGQEGEPGTQGHVEWKGM